MAERISINDQLSISSDELELHAMRSQGAGGQNVNKVASAIHLRFDIQASSLPDYLKYKLLKLNDSRITKDGVLVIKGQQHRTQELNKDDVVARLVEIIAAAAKVQRHRVPTRPTKSAKRKRVESKVKKGQIKALRGKVKP